MATSSAASRVFSKVFLSNNGVISRSFYSANQLAAKNSKPKDQKERKTKKASAKVEIEKPLIPQNQEEYDKFISNYKNDEFFAYDPYSYYEIENELLRHRQPQPKKPALY